MVKTCDVYVAVPFINTELKKKIEALGVVACLDAALNVKSLGPFNNFKYLYMLFKQFKKIQPDIVLNYTIKPVIWGSFAARFAGVKQVASMITGLGYAFTDVTSFKRKSIHNIVSMLYKYALVCNQVVFFQNKDDVELFEQKKLLGNTRPTIINGSGVNLSHFYYSDLFPKKITFLMMGRLLKDKGIYEYVEAARRIKLEYDNVAFNLVGWLDHNPASVTEDELNTWCNEGIINFLGRQDDVRASLESASVFVLPSYREGTPRSVLEAMSMGRPVITTDAPGCRETVIDGENGYLVPVKSVEQLITSMKKFLSNPETIQHFGTRSRSFVTDKYDVYKVNHVIMDALGVS